MKLSESEYAEVNRARNKIIDLLHNDDMAKRINPLYPYILPVLDYASAPMNFPETQIIHSALNLARAINRMET